jgi:hypothetical protein
MLAEAATYRAGEIVQADSRDDALPSEPNKLRLAVAVEESSLFAASYPKVMAVPLTDGAVARFGLRRAHRKQLSLSYQFQDVFDFDTCCQGCLGKAGDHFR